MAAMKSSPVAVFRLTLVRFVDEDDCEDDGLLLSVVVTDVVAGAAVAQAASRIMHSNITEIKVEVLFILFSWMAIDFAKYKFAG